MKIWFNIFLLIFVFNISVANAQIGLQCEKMTTPHSTFSTFQNTIFNFDTSLQQTQIPAARNLKTVSPKNFTVKAIPKCYNYHKLAFFCKVEVDIEKSTKFPVKFRLGDVNYVDQLEGK